MTGSFFVIRVCVLSHCVPVVLSHRYLDQKLLSAEPLPKAPNLLQSKPLNRNRDSIHFFNVFLQLQAWGAAEMALPDCDDQNPFPLAIDMSWMYDCKPL